MNMYELLFHGNFSRWTTALVTLFPHIFNHSDQAEEPRGSHLINYIAHRRKKAIHRKENNIQLELCSLVTYLMYMMVASNCYIVYYTVFLEKNYSCRLL